MSEETQSNRRGFLVKSAAGAALLIAGLGAGPVFADTVSCTGGNSTFTAGEAPPLTVFICDSGNINGNAGQDDIVDAGYLLLDKTDEAKGLVQGSLTLSPSGTTGKSGTWSIDTTALTGYRDFIIGFKAGNGFGSFELNGATDGTWEISRDISHANLYGTVVPIPAAVWLFGSALAGLVGVGYRGRAAKA